VRFRFGDHLLDTERRELRRGGEAVDIEPQVFDLLLHLLRNRERVVSKDDLIAAVWGGRIVSDAAIDSRVKAARQAIGDSGAAQTLIRTFPRKGIRFIGTAEEETAAAPAADAPAEEPARPALPLPDRPSIAVLPFQNMSGDPEQEYFADGIVEEIITALSHIRWLFVIARNSSFTYKGRAVDIKQVGRELGVRYVLEGSVRKAGGRIRIAAQLIEAESGAHLWADHFDGSLEDVFDLQDQVAISVAGIIEPTLVTAETGRSTRRPTGDLTAYDLYLRAFPLSHLSRESQMQALDLLEQAIERDPRYGPALAWAARLHQQIWTNHWADDREAHRRKGIELARQAIEFAPNDARALAMGGFVLGDCGEDLDAAIALTDRALALTPSYAIGWTRSGWLRVRAGEPIVALSCFEKAARLSPLEIRYHVTGTGVALFFQRRFGEAVPRLGTSIQLRPSYMTHYRYLAACYAHLGQLDAAREIVERARAVNPNYNFVYASRYFRRAEDRELLLSGLRLAAGQTM
jgi:TolB-like protein/Tfp pilus assembly protein PilF